MHIETFKVFCDLAETGSFSLAASKNFVTQSAVSQQVRSLEERYRQVLVERSRGRVRLTHAGEVMYRSGKEIVRKYHEIEDNLQTLSRSVAGTLRVATVHSVGLYGLSSPLKSYLQTFPEVDIHLAYTWESKIYEDVGRGDIDLGIVAYPSKRPQVLVTPFREDCLVLVCASQHPLAQFSHISIKRLDREKFVGFERSVAARRVLDRIFRRHRVKVHYVTEVDNMETIKRMVEIGSGVSVVSELSIVQEVKNNTLKAIHFADERVMQPLGIISKRGRRFTPAVQEFIDFLTGKTLRSAAGTLNGAPQATA